MQRLVEDEKRETWNTNLFLGNNFTWYLLQNACSIDIEFIYRWITIFLIKLIVVVSRDYRYFAKCHIINGCCRPYTLYYIIHMLYVRTLYTSTLSIWLNYSVFSRKQYGEQRFSIVHRANDVLFSVQRSLLYRCNLRGGDNRHDTLTCIPVRRLRTSVCTNRICNYNRAQFSNPLVTSQRAQFWSGLRKSTE